MGLWLLADAGRCMGIVNWRWIPSALLATPEWHGVLWTLMVLLFSDGVFWCGVSFADHRLASDCLGVWPLVEGHHVARDSWCDLGAWTSERARASSWRLLFMPLM